jgi:NAD(P)-dependent dehydrogenase (short-subunit alcohol dehydrogenase family)
MNENDAVYPSLRGARVFVSGGASGIGAEIVTRFAAQGAQVGFVDIAAEAGHALVAKLVAAGYPAPRFKVCDLRDIAAYQAALRGIAAQMGGLDVLVNNAAHDERHDWRTVTPAYWEDRLAVNLRHQFFAIQAAAPLMQEAGGGSIINFGSISWRRATGGMPAYTSAKAGVEGLMRSFARDLGPDRIRVNCILPGWIMTERQRALWLTPEAQKATLELQCLKELMQPSDVAKMVLWLASAESRMCTAQCWTVDGGWD